MRQFFAGYTFDVAMPIVVALDVAKTTVVAHHLEGSCPSLPRTVDDAETNAITSQSNMRLWQWVSVHRM